MDDGGRELYSLRDIVGHKTSAMTQRYAHLSPDHKRKMVDRMEQIWRGLQTGHRRCPLQKILERFFSNTAAPQRLPLRSTHSSYLLFRPDINPIYKG
jgi:hypothetical protein